VVKGGSRGEGGEMSKTLYVHMNKRKEQKIKRGGYTRKAAFFYLSVSPF
jgi:hypothetical protein